MFVIYLKLALNHLIMKYVNFIFFLLISLNAFVFDAPAQVKMTNKIKIPHIEKDFSINEFNNEFWTTAKNISIEKYWSGKIAPNGRHFKAKIFMVKYRAVYPF